MQPTYFSGLDLGQTSDPSALVILERQANVRRPSYFVRYLDRYPLGTPYTGQPGRPGIVEQVRTLMIRPPLPGSTLAVDQTGVGRPVVDFFRGLRAAVGIVPVTITAGHHARFDDERQEWHVPKKDLVATLQALLQAGRLLIADSLPLADTLRQELLTFKVKITASANETFGAWRDGDHDDLVLACAVAAWVGEHQSYDPKGISSAGGRHASPFSTSRAW